jgi:hypothetical protein
MADFSIAFTVLMDFANPPKLGFGTLTGLLKLEW